MLSPQVRMSLRSSHPARPARVVRVIASGLALSSFLALGLVGSSARAQVAGLAVAVTNKDALARLDGSGGGITKRSDPAVVRWHTSLK